MIEHWFSIPKAHLGSLRLPFSIRIFHQIDNDFFILNVLDPKKDFLDVHPADDILSFDIVARNFLDGHTPNQAKRLSLFHGF